MIYANVTELIGRTPIVNLSRYAGLHGCRGRILAKLEKQNPAGSAKDRVALSMIRAAEESGQLSSGGLIIEPTSGNTGIGLAACAAVLGYRCCIVMPDSMSPERIKLMQAYGAQVILTPGKLGMSGAVKKAQELKDENPGSIITGQFSNPSNPQAHYETTGPEIWEDCGGSVDVLVSAVGTGGTISGTGRYLKEKDPDIHIVAVEPDRSPLLSKGYSGTHGIQGIGANFVPETLDKDIYDEIFCCTDVDAFSAMRALAKTEGILCGISSGAALHAACTIAQRAEYAGKTIVCIFPDTGEHYLSIF